jgi:VWFA-related protein
LLNNLFIFAAALALVLQPAQTPNFRTEVNYVELHVSVTTKDGQRVHGLTKADFAVKESGAAQVIQSVDEISLPLPPPKSAGVVEPDGSVSDSGLLDSGRIYTIVIDRSHLDIGNAPKLRKQLAEFIDDFVTPADLVSVVNLGSATITPFTTNKTRLRLGLGLMSAYRGGSDSADLQAPAVEGKNAGEVAQSIADNIALFAASETYREATSTTGGFDAMDALAKYLRGFEGRRKALVYVSNGTDVNLPVNSPDAGTPNVTGAQTAVAGSFDRMVKSMQANNITVYSIDPSGLETFDPFDGAGSAQPLSNSFGPRWVAPLGMLRAMADDTGGFPVIGENNLTKPFARIVEDNSQYYVIGYSSNRPADGKPHSIDVRVMGRDVAVRTRGEIEGASSKAKPSAVDAAWRKTDVASLLARPVPTADPGLRMRLTASSIGWRGDSAIVHLALEIHEGGLSLNASPAGFADDVVAAFQAIDDKGALKAAKSETVKLRVRPETRDAIRDRGWRYVTEFELPRGVYQLRVAASESSGGRSGSAFLDLAIPDARKEPLSIVGLALADDAARLIPTAGAAPILRALGPIVVTGSRAFNSSETLTVIAAMADNIAGDHDATISAVLVGSDGAVAKQIKTTAASKDLRPDAPPRALALPLSGVPPGDYSLLVKIDAAGKSARRSLVIRVLR